MMSKSLQKIFGVHAVEQVLLTRPESITQVWMLANQQSKQSQKLRLKCEQLGLTIQNVSRAMLDDMANGRRHQGVILEAVAHAKQSQKSLDEILAEGINADSLFLILDSVQDPHNLGACIRTALAAGVTAVIIPKDRAASVNETVRKVASGAAEEVNVITVVNLVRAIEQLKLEGVWIVGTSGEAEQSIYQVDMTGPTAIVMGGEDNGLRQSIRKACDYLVSIPIIGNIESLNVSVAAGVALYEVVRQKQMNLK